ncbi:cytochrome c [Betaproteobacteria bacterium]|nr:cytochrome c [Betaproteobacteria bacterium]GHT97735.1 cytochrome c [Betaproteobacteria bacterium]GHU22282.1 cytochrome c [Betaproteobacteria bacterium]GHU32614.1 cytochrome c [Betaproteobacteria bacterium]
MDGTDYSGRGDWQGAQQVLAYYNAAFACSSMFRLPVFSVLLMVCLSACSPTPEDDRPGQPVKHRQEAFKVILRASEPIGLMLGDDKFDAENFARLAARLSEVRDGPWAYYGADTNYPPSKSRDEVWSQPDKFAVERQRFQNATDTLRAATTRDAAQTAYNELRASCKACHNGFRR